MDTVAFVPVTQLMSVKLNQLFSRDQSWIRCSRLKNHFVNESKLMHNKSIFTKNKCNITRNNILFLKSSKAGVPEATVRFLYVYISLRDYTLSMFNDSCW